ncbi:MAG: hypothetical protein WCH01_23330, partial [Methylococcaceae bacterium]
MGSIALHVNKLRGVQFFAKDFSRCPDRKTSNYYPTANTFVGPNSPMRLHLEPVYDLSVTYFPKQHLVKKLEGPKSLTHPFADILFFYRISVFSVARLLPPAYFLARF